MTSPAPPQQVSRSPSPSPSLDPPVPTAPGPRATALQRLYSEAIAHVLKTCSYANFSACFPTPAKQVPLSIQNLHAQFTDKLGESMRRQFATLMEDRGVVGRLNELDGLVEDARARKEKGTDELPIPYVSWRV